MTNNSDTICLSNCFKSDIVVHPFNGPLYIDKIQTICASDELFDDCNNKSKIDLNIINTLNSPLKPHLYLKHYYNINNLLDAINYIKLKNPINNTKIRLLDLFFLKFNTTIENDIINWTELIKIIFNKNTLNDNIIIKCLKKINSKYNLSDENIYPLDLFTKLKKYLDQ